MLVHLSNARRPYGDIRGNPVPLTDGGTATFGDLPAGLYLAQITMNGQQRDMVVRVPAAGETTFTQTAIAGLAVTVTDPAGALAAAGFETGDVIVAMDGTEIDSMTRADTVRYAARTRDRMSVDVLRTGSRRTLTVVPSKFGFNDDYGGWWEPVLR
jgi:S1-C subfamily serine protease